MAGQSAGHYGIYDLDCNNKDDDDNDLPTKRDLTAL
jgi:hypothetical protein